MGKEMTPQEAWILIQEKHKRLANAAFTRFLKTGKLDVSSEDEPPSTYVITSAAKKSLTYDSGRRIFIRDGKSYGHLTKNENLLFTLLLAQPDEILTYKQLYLHFYPDDTQPVSTRQLAELFRPAISRLREKLEQLDPTLPDIIQTVRGTGYVYTLHFSLRE